MENQLISKEISLQKSTYAIHIIDYLVLLFIYFMIEHDIYWLNESLYYIFEVDLYIFFIFYITLIIIYILFSTLYIKHQKGKNLFLKFSLAMFFIVSINSLFISIVSCYNSTLFDTFFSECPFNFKPEKIPAFFTTNLLANNKLKNICKSRRCYPINDENTNIYLCNFYDANLYSKLYSNDDNEYYIKYNDIYEYMIFCEEYATFYINKKEGYKEYDITNDFLCPSKSTIVYCYILIYLFIFVSLFCSSVFWLFEFSSFKKINSLLLDLANRNISLRETNNTSKIDNNNNSLQNNNELQNNNKVDIIIVTKNNKNMINNMQNGERIVEINNNENKIYINENQKKDERNNINNDVSKSHNQLIINGNNNIFKIINKKEPMKKDENKK